MRALRFGETKDLAFPESGSRRPRRASVRNVLPEVDIPVIVEHVVDLAFCPVIGSVTLLSFAPA